ncbi:hypothetical protein HMPREF9345_04143 [Escherichia coli MS 107-1]|nr:hypothetical protein HMPREF9345_04143 [Escherichia coli MS 107-1]ESD82221.1 hypothetical protein HMPREF1611_03601 [Escherichia coli 908573]
MRRAEMEKGYQALNRRERRVCFQRLSTQTAAFPASAMRMR